MPVGYCALPFSVGIYYIKLSTKVTYGQVKYDTFILSILIKLIISRILLPTESGSIKIYTIL